MTRHTLTTNEAAELTGLSPVTIRRWVMRGWLTPVTPPGSRPLRFDALEVHRAHRAHSSALHQRLDNLWRAALAYPPADGER